MSQRCLSLFYLRKNIAFPFFTWQFFKRGSEFNRLIADPTDRPPDPANPLHMHTVRIWIVHYLCLLCSVFTVSSSNSNI